MRLQFRLGVVCTTLNYQYKADYSVLVDHAFPTCNGDVLINT